jgi:hypothetical protein
MAVDTRNKRASCLGFANPPFAVFPNPDGAITSQADRQHIAYVYPGILAGEAAVNPDSGWADVGLITQVGWADVGMITHVGFGEAGLID